VRDDNKEESVASSAGGDGDAFRRAIDGANEGGFEVAAGGIAGILFRYGLFLCDLNEKGRTWRRGLFLYLSTYLV
jgi:hypothetical protein